MNDPASPLALDQPEQHVYEPPHHIDTITADDDVTPLYIDADWMTFPNSPTMPYVWARIDCRRRQFDVTVMNHLGMDAGEALKIAHYIPDAVRWATGEIEKLNTPPAPHGGGTSQDASGG